MMINKATNAYTYQLSATLQKAQSITVRQAEGSQNRLDKARMDASDDALKALEIAVTSKETTLEVGAKVNVYV